MVSAKGHIIGLFTGSIRKNSNAVGVASFASHHIAQVFPSSTIVELPAAVYAGVPESDIPPMVIKNSKDYPDSRTQDFSKHVKSCSGFVFVCPEYNHSYPAAMKSMIDQLYHEFVGKPGVIVSYGGGSCGSNASNELKSVFKTIKVTPTAVVNVRLPMEFLTTSKRVHAPYDPKEPSFLRDYAQEITEAFESLKTHLNS